VKLIDHSALSRVDTYTYKEVLRFLASSSALWLRLITSEAQIPCRSTGYEAIHLSIETLTDVAERMLKMPILLQQQEALIGFYVRVVRAESPYAHDAIAESSWI
jgi:hypothetical protein